MKKISRFGADGLPLKPIIVRDTVADNTHATTAQLTPEADELIHNKDDNAFSKAVFDLTAKHGYNTMCLIYSSSSNEGQKAYKAVRKSIATGKPANTYKDKDTGEYPWYHGHVFCFSADLDEKMLTSPKVKMTKRTAEEAIGHKTKTNKHSKICDCAIKAGNMIAEKYNMEEFQRKEIIVLIRDVFKKGMR